MMKVKSFGFTLIELLVVMAIIAVLAAVGLGSYQTAQVKSRDAKRKQDLEQVQRALEMYYNDKKRYPAETELVWGEEFHDPDVLETIYMKQLPTDSRFIYDYITDTNGTYFKLYARLENNNDPKITTPNETTDCGSGNLCNYGISSPNKNP